MRKERVGSVYSERERERQREKDRETERQRRNVQDLFDRSGIERNCMRRACVCVGTHDDF